jgi:predicted Zn finger-like uncharacterized protein
MAEVILNCPQCQRSLRVTDDLLGRLVKCPACGMTFTVSSGQHTQVPDEPPLALPADTPFPQRPHPTPAQESWEAAEDVRDQAKAYTGPAAIFIMIVGGLSLLAGLAQVVLSIASPDRVMENAAQLQEMFGLAPASPEVMQASSIGGGIAGSLAGVVLVLAGVQMIRLRMYPFCIIGSVLAMINCTNFCCLLGLPLGLWSLIVLIRPDVRAAFH